MATRTERKEHPISMRLPEADVAMIDRAARLHGRSRTDFVRVAAVRAAEDVLMETALIRMSAEDFADFMVVVSIPASPVPEMTAVVKRPAPWEPGHVAKLRVFRTADLGAGIPARPAECLRRRTARA